MASEVDDADGVWAPLACEEAAEVVLAAVEATPLVPGGELGFGGDRFCALAEACEAMDWLLDLRVEPTSLRKRWFIDDMETSSASAPDGSGGWGRREATMQLGRSALGEIEQAVRPMRAAAPHDPSVRETGAAQPHVLGVGRPRHPFDNDFD